jgi:hypothetical protein
MSKKKILAALLGGVLVLFAASCVTAKPCIPHKPVQVNSLPTAYEGTVYDGMSSEKYPMVTVSIAGTGTNSNCTYTSVDIGVVLGIGVEGGPPGTPG